MIFIKRTHDEFVRELHMLMDGCEEVSKKKRCNEKEYDDLSDELGKKFNELFGITD